MNDNELRLELERLKADIAELKKKEQRNSLKRTLFTRTNMLAGITLSFLLSSIILYGAIIGKPHTFSDGDVISADEMNENFDSLYTELNAKDTRIGNIENNAGVLNGRVANLESSSTLYGGRITVLEGKDYDSVQVRFIIALCGLWPPRDEGEYTYDTQIVGEIRMFAGYFAPTGWAFCDGRLLNINQYTALYALLGTTHGGNGTTTFALPDLRGKVAVHPAP